MGEHRDYVKREVLTEPAGEHFNSRGHKVSHLKGQALEQIRSRDHMLINKFDTFENGLNREP